jgi:hypothetical protein
MKIFDPVWASTALKMSSRRYISQSWYTALASWIRCFWPPLRLIPHSPISVWSTNSIISKSFSRQQACMTSEYLSGCIDFPNKMFSWMVPFRIQAVWATNVVLPHMQTYIKGDRDQMENTYLKRYAHNRWVYALFGSNQRLKYKFFCKEYLVGEASSAVYK